jgi:hypothetical protein
MADGENEGSKGTHGQEEPALRCPEVIHVPVRGHCMLDPVEHREEPKEVMQLFARRAREELGVLVGLRHGVPHPEHRASEHKRRGPKQDHIAYHGDAKGRPGMRTISCARRLRLGQFS